MTPCSLCQTPLAADQLDRFSGLDLCQNCCQTDPTAALHALGVPVQWDVSLGRFSAGAFVGHAADPGFSLSCVRQKALHRVVKWVVHEVEVGDPIFDDRVYVRTTDPEEAARLLASSGTQSALLALLADAKPNEMVPNHVTYESPTLEVSVRLHGPLDDARILDLKLETAALALGLQQTLADSA